MSILNTLKRVFGIQSELQNYAEDQTKENYPSEKPIQEGEHWSEQVQGTPLYIRGDKEQGFYVVLGSYKVTEKIEDLMTARAIVEHTDWKTVMNVIAVMIETAFKIEGKELPRKAEVTPS